MENNMGMTHSYPDLDADGAVCRMAGALTYKTVSFEDTSLMDAGQFRGLHEHIRAGFPHVHREMQRSIINDLGLMYRWPGRTKADPALFMSHLDVVPEGNVQEWKYPPFSGQIAEGCVWGRGAIDTKSMAMAELEAAEYLIARGFMPDRDVYFCFGQDEETMGRQGSYTIMELLRDKGLRLDFVLDEGQPFEDGAKFGAAGVLLAYVGICEKGYLDMEVTAQSPGGHSSTPGERTALGEAARAVAAIEDAKFPEQICSPVREFYQAIRPYIKDAEVAKLVDNMQQDPSQLAKHLLRENWSAAMVRTTTAATMAQASPAPNVLPQQARMLFNFRTMPGHNLQDVLSHCRQAASGYDVAISMAKGMEASQVSRTDTHAYELLKRAINEYFPTAVAAPHLMTCATDARYFEEICDCVYRFRPFLAEMKYRDTVHAANERMDIESYIHGVKFFIRLMETALDRKNIR